MSAEHYYRRKIPEPGQPSALDRSSRNPGWWRSGERNDRPRLLLIHPSSEINDAGLWGVWLSTRSNEFQTFQGDAYQAGVLLTALNEGKLWMTEAIREAGMNHFTMPATAISRRLPRRGDYPNVFYEKGLNLISVDKRHLEEVSTLQHDRIYQGTAKHATTFVGIIPDWFRLAGVEEAHHAVFRYATTDNSTLKRSTTCGRLVEYDSTDVEFTALKWQIRYARERKMPRWTLRALQDRLKAAQVLRRNSTTETPL